MSEDNSLERDIGKLSYLLNQIKEPIVCVKCSDEFMTGQTDAKSLQDYSRIDVGSVSYTHLTLPTIYSV